MNDLFISIDYNDREIKGVQSFKAALKKDYLCQVRPKWIPSCSEGAELWMHIFINSEIYDFLKNIIISGLIWDGIKYAGKTYIFTPLFQHLERLNIDNEMYGGIKMEKMVLQFDDCKIDVYGLKTNFTSILSSIFNKIATLKPKFEKEFGLKVINIKIPAFTDFEKCELPIFLDKWMITFYTGSPIKIYDFKTGRLCDLTL